MLDIQCFDIVRRKEHFILAGMACSYISYQVKVPSSIVSFEEREQVLLETSWCLCSDVVVDGDDDDDACLLGEFRWLSFLST